MSDSDARSDRSDVASLVEALTTAEKLELTHGDVDPAERATGYLPGNEDHGIPPISFVDGPMGIRAGEHTAFPASLSLAASWDPDLAREFGRALAAEARSADQDILLAPGCNLVRVPQCGRAFEYYGEDPHLNARTTVGTIEGIQEAGVAATVKHYVCNNQEADRHTVSAAVGERALRELYLPPFRAAVQEADVASVMASYNRVNGTYAPQHRRLLTEVLKEEWGFEGFVVSDWWATHDGPAAARAGLDLDMPGLPVDEWHAHGSGLFDFADRLPAGAGMLKRGVARLATLLWQPPNPNPNLFLDSPFDEPVAEAIERGDLDASILDDKVERILGQAARFGLFEDERDANATDAGQAGSDDPNESLTESDADIGGWTARADDGPADGVDEDEHRDLARRMARRGTVLLQNREDVLPIDENDDVALVGPDADRPKVGGGGSSAVTPVRTVSPLEGLRSRCGPRGTVTLERGTDRVGEADSHAGFGVDFDLSLPFGTDTRRADAVTAARGADVTVVVVRDEAMEGADRSLGLPGDQDDLIADVASAADRTVVVCNTAGAIEMPWAAEVEAIVQPWYPGQEDGHALADVLYGDVDPGGRLPVTIGRAAGDYPATAPEQYPGVDGTAQYSEGVFVGYRHFDGREVEPRFPFGHGLSYADVTWGEADLSVADGGEDLDATSARVTLALINESDRPAREVVQVYVAPDDPPVQRPPQELGAYEAVHIEANETVEVTVPIPRRAFARYDADESEWTVDGGTYQLRIGRSSREIEDTVPVQVPDS